MKRFILNLLIALLAMSPIFIYYIAADPYSVIWRKDFETCPNVGVRGLMALDKHSDIHYDSFVFGSSRSENYRIDDWKCHIDSGANAFHAQQSGDNLRGTTDRLEYLHNRYGKINNALIIMDHDFLSGLEQKTGYQFRNPWRITGKSNFILYHKDFFMAFCEFDNQLIFLGLKDKSFRYRSIYVSKYDEFQYVGNDSMLDNGFFDTYYKTYVIPRGDFYWFYERDSIEKIGEPIISDAQIQLLYRIKKVFVADNTKYRIVIGPLFDQIKMNPQDVKKLQDIFGKDMVFDFSGINDYTNDKSNYYEASHYRPHVCKQIMNEIYK